MLSVDAAAVDDLAAAGELVTSAAVYAGAPTASTIPSSSAAAVGAYFPAGAVVVVADVSTSLSPTEAAAGTAVLTPSSMNSNVRGLVTVAIILKPSVGGALVGGGLKKAPVTDTPSDAEVVVGLGIGSSWPS